MDGLYLNMCFPIAFTPTASAQKRNADEIMLSGLPTSNRRRGANHKKKQKKKTCNLPGIRLMIWQMHTYVCSNSRSLATRATRTWHGAPCNCMRKNDRAYARSPVQIQTYVWHGCIHTQLAIIVVCLMLYDKGHAMHTIVVFSPAFPLAHMSWVFVRCLLMTQAQPEGFWVQALPR